MKKIFFILSISFLLQPIFVFAQTTPNAGLVEHTIWYSKDPFFEGDIIKVYTLLYNGGAYPVSGTVTFYDVNVILGSKDVVVPAESPANVFVNWTVTAGSHSISAKFLNPSITVSGKKEVIPLQNESLPQQTFFVPKKIVSANTEIVTVGESTTSSSDSLADNVAQSLKPYAPVPVVETISALDGLREQTSEKFITSKNETQTRIDVLKKNEQTTSAVGHVTVATNSTTVSVGSMQKPLAYISLFFWTILSFIFSHKTVFYGLCLLIIFLIIRFVWKKLRKK